MGWSQVGQSQGRSGCCLESCSCPSRCPVCAPFATSFSLSVGSRSCCLHAGVFFGWHKGSAVCSTARVASAAGQATATSPANSERSSESSPKPIAQADPGSGPPGRRAAICRACVRRHRHHRRRLRDRRLRACAPPPSPRTASDTAASEPTASDPAVSEPAIPSSAAPVAFRCGSLWSEPPAAPSVPPSAPPPSRARRLRPSQYLQRRSPRCVRSLRVLSCVSGTRQRLYFHF